MMALENQRAMDQEIRQRHDKNKHHNINNYGEAQFQTQNQSNLAGANLDEDGNVKLYTKERSPTYLTCKLKFFH